jgi:hypothetical protein
MSAPGLFEALGAVATTFTTYATDRAGNPNLTLTDALHVALDHVG